MKKWIVEFENKYKECKQFIDDTKPKSGRHANEGSTVYDHIMNILKLMENNNITDKLDLFIGRYHDIGKCNVYLNERNKDQIELNKLSGKNSMPYFGHEIIDHVTNSKLITVGLDYGLTHDEIFIVQFVIRHHMIDIESIINNNKKLYNLFKEFPLISDKVKSIKSLITLIEYDHKFEISSENKNKILNSFSDYVKEKDKGKENDFKICSILKGRKLGNYILFKLPNIPGPIIKELKDKIYLNIDKINWIGDMDDILKKEKPEYIEWNRLPF